MIGKIEQAPTTCLSSDYNQAFQRSWIRLPQFPNTVFALYKGTTLINTTLAGSKFRKYIFCLKYSLWWLKSYFITHKLILKVKEKFWSYRSRARHSQGKVKKTSNEKRTLNKTFPRIAVSKSINALDLPNFNQLTWISKKINCHLFFSECDIFCWKFTFNVNRFHFTMNAYLKKNYVFH